MLFLTSAEMYWFFCIFTPEIEFLISFGLELFKPAPEMWAFFCIFEVSRQIQEYVLKFKAWFFRAFLYI